MTVIETEVKFTIHDRHAFARLLAAVGEVERLTHQLNVYLDTPDHRIASAGFSLRLRIANQGAATWTTKRRRGRSDGTFVSEETEASADHAQAVSWVRAGRGFVVPRVPEMSEVLRAVGNEPLIVMTWSLTHRYTARANGFEFELDETIYPDGAVDYELEAEHPDAVAAAKALESLCAAAGVRFEPAEHSKRARARKHASPDAPIPIDLVAG